MSFKHFLVMMGSLLLASSLMCPAYAELYKVEKKSWKPVADEVYLQEIGTQITTQTPVKAMATLNDTTYAVMDDKLHVVRGTALEPVAEAPTGIMRVCALQGSLWVVTQTGTFRFEGKVWTKIGDEQYVDFCIHLNTLYAATKDDLAPHKNLCTNSGSGSLPKQWYRAVI